MNGKHVTGMSVIVCICLYCVVFSKWTNGSCYVFKFGIFKERPFFFRGDNFPSHSCFSLSCSVNGQKNDPVMCLNLEFFKRKTVCFRGDNLSFYCFHCSVNGQNFPCICVLNVAFLSLDENNLYNKFLTRCQPIVFINIPVRI